jgi:putative peptidoglycan lipid II flippase
MLVPILPRFSEQVTENRIDDLKAEFRRGVRILWFLSLPIAALLIAIPKPILACLYMRGNFTPADVSLFAVALVWLAPSILFYVGRDLITRVFYAYKDSKTPYQVAMVAIVLKGIFDWVLIKPLGVGGISLSTTLVTVFNLSALGWLLRRKIGSLGASLLLRPLAIMLGGSCLCSVIACYIQKFSMNALFPVERNPLLNAETRLTAIEHSHFFFALAVSIAVASAVAFAIYLVICLACKLEEPYEVLKRLKRRKSTG